MLSSYSDYRCELMTYNTGTGIFQPADVGLQRILKHRFRQHSLRYLVDSHTQQLRAGLTPENVRFNTSLPVLRNTSVMGLVDTWEFMQTSEGNRIVKKVCALVMSTLKWCLKIS